MDIAIEIICEHADGQSFMMVAIVNRCRYLLRTTTAGVPDYISQFRGTVQIRHSTASMRKLVVSAPELGQHTPELDPVCAAVLARGYPLTCLRFYVRRLLPNADFIRGVLPAHSVDDSIASQIATAKKRGRFDRPERITKIITPTRTDSHDPPSWLISHQSLVHDPIAIEIAMPDAYERPDDLLELLQRISELPTR
ncbi:hypothetical protein KBC55_01440 [Patescibacteria group bacterium]|nr:hypothetical protein [Patescibacteria group bacterium]